MLLAALLFAIARIYRRAEDDRERAEIATAELEDARERELESAAIAERGRMARELHDVLAHSLSGLSLQLEGARLVAEHERVSPELQETLSRSRRLASEGLEEAKRVAHDIASKAPVATRLAKEAVDRAYESTLQLGLEYERRALYLAFASEDAKEGLSAFTEKRQPDFRGR